MKRKDGYAMTLYHLKMHLKNNKIIMGVYNALSGNRKAEKAEQLKRCALATTGMKSLERVEQALEGTGAQIFLAYGSLLGIIREGKFLSHDNDIDLGIVIDEKFQWSDLQEAMVRSGMKKVRQFEFRGECTEQTYQDADLTIDFFRYYNMPDASYAYTYYRKDGYIYDSPDQFHAFIVYSAPYAEIKPMEIDGVTFHIPGDPEAYLASVYGENWRIPDPSWDSANSPNVKHIEDELATVHFYKSNASD